MKRLVLASASPRRREILSAAGYEYDVIPSGAPEEEACENARELVIKNAMLKADDVYSRLGDKNAVVLGADTLVCVNGKILGKPKDASDAKRMLRELSGSKHEVITGYAVISENFAESGACVTKVYFRTLTESEIDSYVATGEPLDKAGAYGIQERGSVLAEGVQGDFFNVIGLPVSSVYPLLAKLGILPH